jgi:uncharacterized protein YrrD
MSEGVSKVILSGSELIGKPVIVRDGRNIIEVVEDIMFDHISRQIVALIIDKGKSGSTTRILSWGGIQTIEKDTVVAKSQGMIVEAKQLLTFDRILEFGKDVVGKQLMTTEGHILGKVMDVYFNAHTGEIAGFQIAGSIFDDGVRGRYFAPIAEITNFANDGVFVSPTSARLFEEQARSWQREIWNEWQSLMEGFESALGLTQKKVATTTDTARQVARIANNHMYEGLDDVHPGERLSEAASRGQKTIGELTEQARDQLKQVLAERVVGQAKGYPAQHTVLTDDNEFVVVAGQIVSQDVIEQARQHHQEVALMESVGLDFESLLNDNALNLQKVIRRYANQWHSDGDAIIDSLRDTAIKLEDDAKTRLEKARE